METELPVAVRKTRPFRGRLGVLALVLAAFAGFFWWAYTSVPAVKVAARPSSVKAQGVYSGYVYVISNVPGAGTYVSTFQPPLKGDDVLVAGAMREMMQTVYGEKLDPDLQPAVEVLHETNYLTFPSAAGKVYFQLFKNTAGEVGSITFWRTGTKY